MWSNPLDDDRRLTLYRVRVVERWPDSPQKATLMVALQRRLNSLEESAVRKGTQQDKKDPYLLDAE